MARQVYSFDVTIPAGTPKSAPVTTNLQLPVLIVDRVRIRIPPGPSGAMGFTLGVSGQQIIPYQFGKWLIADNEVIDLDLSDYPESGRWQLTGYNVGAYDHTIFLLFALDLLPPPPLIFPQPIPAALLAGT